MRCLIPASNIKVFGRAIHSLSKIGDELYVEAEVDKGLSLRTVNSSRSAFASFLFPTTFFVQFSCLNDATDAQTGATSRQVDVDKQNDDDDLKCKISMKPCLQVFKSLSLLEKMVDKCSIELKPEEDRLVIKLYCKHGIVKTHNLSFIECETLQAVFSKQDCPNILKVNTRLLSDVVSQFCSGQEELSLCVSQEKVIIRSYVDEFNAEDKLRCIRTEMNLSPEEFEEYSVSMNTEITFCLKELKAILMFSDPADLSVTMHFETAGRPIVFSVSTDLLFEGNFVLATMADQSATQQRQQLRASQSQQGQQQRASQSQQLQNQASAAAVQQLKNTTSQKKESKKTHTEKENEVITSKSTTTDNRLNLQDKRDKDPFDKNGGDRSSQSSANKNQAADRLSQASANQNRAGEEPLGSNASTDRVTSSNKSNDIYEGGANSTLADDSLNIADVTIATHLNKSITNHLHDGKDRDDRSSPVIPMLANNDAANFTCNVSVLASADTRPNQSTLTDASKNRFTSTDAGIKLLTLSTSKPNTTGSNAKSHVNQKSNLFSGFDDDDDDDDEDDDDDYNYNHKSKGSNEKDVVVGTPPAKKFCMSFVGLSQLSTAGNSSSQTLTTSTHQHVDKIASLVLAQDSDED